MEKLNSRLASGEEHERLHRVFHVNDARAELTPAPSEEIWDGAAVNLAKFLGYYVDCFLASAPYNAAKHGLTLTAGHQGVELGAGDDPAPFLQRRGDALQYLTVKRGEDRAKWVRELKWVSSKRSIPMIYLGCRLIQAIWEIGAGRYGIRKPEQIHLFNEPEFDEVMERGDYRGEGLEGIEVMGFEEGLLYHADG